MIEITYYYDSHCGWCYGFSSVFQQLVDFYRSKVNFNVVSGGLAIGDRVGWINDSAPYVKAGAYKSVEETTGVKFGEVFLRELNGEGKIRFDSKPGAIALCIIREQFPEKANEFTAALLKAIYEDGTNPTDSEAFVKEAIAFGMDALDFKNKMKNPKYLRNAEIEFQSFQESGIRGMPALVFEGKEERRLLANGFTPLDVLKERIDNLLQ